MRNARVDVVRIDVAEVGISSPWSGDSWRSMSNEKHESVKLQAKDLG